MSKPETTFTASVHKHLPPGRKDPYWMKNSNLYTSGIWDVWYSGVGGDLWVEYKFIVLPKRDSTVIGLGLSDLQLQWGADRAREGRNLAVIVGCKEGGVILRDPLEWGTEWSKNAFIDRLVSREAVARWISRFTLGLE